MRALTDDQLRAFEAQLRPGGISSSGFLATGERLEDVLAADRRMLGDLGLGHGDIADGLEQIIGRAERQKTLALMEWFRRPDAPPQRDGTFEVAGRFDVETRSFMGWQACPFQSVPGHESCATRQRWATTDYVITNRATGESLTIAGLAAHLIRAHGFFEGSVPYRADPRAIARVLALSPANGTTVRWRTTRCWFAAHKIARVPFFGLGGPARYWMDVRHGQGERPAKWRDQRTIAPGVEVARMDDWGVIAVRGVPPIGAELDGEELLIGRAVRGTYALVRSDFECLEIDS